MACFCAPSGASGISCLRRLASSSCTASAPAPAPSGIRRAVALLTCTPTRSLSNFRARSKGIQLARRTSVSSARGVNPPPSSPNSSSRGKKAFPTLRAGSICSPQLDRFSGIGLDPAGLFPSCRQGLAAGRTPGALLFRLLAPGLGLPHLHYVLDHLRPQLVYAFIYRRFDLLPGRFRMLLPPLGHPQHVLQSCTHLLHLLTALSSVLLGFHTLV